jgi:alcohol dehydrogenase, propanol-preferring
MKAVRYIQAGKPPEIVDLPRPVPGPGQVLLRVAAAGVCHSDLHLLDHGRFTNPFTLGHENSGHIAALGDGVTGFKEGDAVAVYGPWGCGHCHSCQHSAENYCHHHDSLPTMGGGLGTDGGMAEYMVVPSPRLLVPLGKLDPVQAAPLSDAALTPYHAIKAALPWLTPDASVVLVGIGGLGHMAVQILKALSPAQIIACDIDDIKLAHAKALGADHTVNSRDPIAAQHAISSLVGERGAAVALDFVGAQPTINLCAGIVGRGSRLTIVGLGGGVLHYGANNPPYGCEVSIPYWGTRAELIEVIALAEAGRIHTEVERFSLEDAPKVYERLREGKIHGRAVLIP